MLCVGLNFHKIFIKEDTYKHTLRENILLQVYRSAFFKQFTFKSMNVNTHLEIQFHSGEKPVSCKEYRLALLMSSNFIKKKKAMKI